MKIKSCEIKQTIYVTEIQDENEVRKSVSVPVNHIFCCDISGSMYGSMESMRNHLKNKIPDIVKKDDTVTIIAFSGRNNCTTIKEMVHVNDINQLKLMNDAIDRYMIPNGCTCFYDPVEVTLNLINKNNGLFNFIFLSDGCNNDCPWEDVVNILNQLQSKIGSATIIEYGYYADTDALNQMAEILGGCKITARDFESYEPVITKAFSCRTDVRKCIDISNIKNSLKYTQFVYLMNGSVNVVSCSNSDIICIPESVDKIYCITKEAVGEKGEFTDVLYAMAYVSSMNMRYNIVEGILSKLGDTKFIEMYCNAFGKQKLFDFGNELVLATFDTNKRGTIDFKYKSNSRAYCVLDLLSDLQDDKSQIEIVKVFQNYNRIGRKSKAMAQLSESTKQKLATAKSEKDLKKIYENAEYESVDMKMIDKGYPMESFVWNEDRANVSALMKIDVELTMPKNDIGLNKVDSYVYRNCTIIKDGILNVKELPVIISESLYKKLCKKTTIEILNVVETNGKVSATINIANTPIINREYTHSINSQDMTNVAKQIMEIKFYLKYLNTKCIFDKQADIWNYNTEQTEYLNKFGITSKGYSPQTEKEKTDEFYMALTFKTTFNKLSSPPKIEDVYKKVNAKKNLTVSEQLMWNVIQNVDITCKNPDDYFKMYKKLSESKTILMRELSKMKFGLILSRKWFSDKNGFDDNHCETKDSFGNTITIDYKFTETKQNM